MKKILYLIFVVIGLASAMNVTAKGVEEMVPKMYVFGVSTSFNDSTVFFTEIMELDSAWVDSKTGFIDNREEYSYQLRDHLASKGYPKRTCVFVSGTNLKKVTKKYDKMKSRFAKKGGCDLLLIDKSEFSFKAISPTQSTTAQQKVEKPVKPKHGPKPHKDK